jgi:hypothetical protein
VSKFGHNKILKNFDTSKLAKCQRKLKMASLFSLNLQNVANTEMEHGFIEIFKVFVVDFCMLQASDVIGNILLSTFLSLSLG